MTNTINITLSKEEYEKYAEMLLVRGFKHIGTRLFEDNLSYVRISIR